MSNYELTNKAHSHILLHVFCLIFSEYITITSSEEALKMCEHNCPLKLVREMLLSHSAIWRKHLNTILYVTATVFKPTIT